MYKKILKILKWSFELLNKVKKLCTVLCSSSSKHEVQYNYFMISANIKYNNFFTQLFLI